MYAVEGGHYECAVLLKEEAGLQNENGDTALMIAIRNNVINCIEFLAPFEKEIINKNSSTAFAEAIRYGMF